MLFSNLDLAVFLVAGAIGALGGFGARSDARWGWGTPLAWAIIAFWARFKLLKW